MDAGMQPLSVVIPTYNAVGQVEGLLTRLSHFKQKYGDDFQVIVADDFSGDDTARVIRQKFDWVEVVANRQNRGFGINVMTGVGAARHPYLATLNSDIDLVGNPFKEMVTALEDDPKLFAVMPMIFNRSLDKVENIARLYCHRGLCWHTELPEEEEWSSVLRDLLTQSTDVKSRLRDLGKSEKPFRSVLCGAAFACRRDRFLELKGFDPRFRPFYWEDVDLDFRARRHGWHCAVLPTTAVIHRHSETINRFHSQRKNHFYRLNQLRFVVSHQDQLEGLSDLWFWWFARGVREMFSGDGELRQAFFRAAFGKTNF